MQTDSQFKLLESNPLNTLVLLGLLRKRNSQAIAGLVAAVIGGLLIGLAWQDSFPFWFGLTGQAFFFASLLSTQSIRLTVLLALMTGGVGTFVSCGPWLPGTIEYLINSGPLITYGLMLGVCLWQTLPFLVAGVTWQLLRTDKLAWIYLPSIWCLSDFMVPDLYPLQLGHLLAEANPLNQLAELGGVHLLTIVAAHIAIVPPVLALGWAERSQRDSSSVGFRKNVYSVGGLVGTLATVSVASIWGAGQFASHQRQWKARSQNPSRLNVMVVQAETEFASSNRRMVKATRQAGDQPDLIVWPESSLGNYNRKLTSFADAAVVREHSRGKGSQFRPLPNPSAPLLAGANTWSKLASGKGETNYVSAILLDENENLVGRHDKIKLMPYGEYIPGESFLPQLRRWFGGKRIISRGDVVEPIGKIDRWNIGAVLCCEDMHPELCRSLSRQGCNILISIGNEMAFSDETPLRQHFRISRLRAIENRRAFVRCMNRGVSAIVSPSGEVVHELPNLSEEAMLVSIPPTTAKTTVFMKYGSTPSWVIVLWMFGAALVGRFRKTKE